MYKLRQNVLSGYERSLAKNLKWLALAAGALLLSPMANAQISGTKTVCASGCDYSSINDAVSALQKNGVNGKTTIQIKKGDYEESFSISGIKGVSATNTITFIGTGTAATDVHIHNTNSPVIEMAKVSYITLQNLHVEQENMDYEYKAIYMYGVTNCTIKNSRITSPIDNSDNYYDMDGIWIENSTDNLIESNIIRGGYDAINEGGYNSGNARNVYKKNSITKFCYDGINAYGSDGNQYISNYFDSGTYQYASAVNSVDESNVKYLSNNMIMASMYYGIFLQPSGDMEFTNNMILAPSDCYYAVYMTPNSSKGNIKFYHNTIDQRNTGGKGVYGVYYDNRNKALIDFRNNLLTATSAVTMYNFNLNPNDIIDGNNYYTGGSALLVYNGTSYSSLSAYQSAAATYGDGANDKNVSAKYKSANDLHIDQTVIVAASKAIGVKTDIDGDARCPGFVTIGADESMYSGNPHFGKPSKPSFTSPSVAYDGNPTVFYNGASASTAASMSFKWYVNGKFVSDSLHLETIALTGPTSKVKLVAETCGGKDSTETTITVSTPPNAPTSDFISDKNVIRQGDVVKFTDLSADYPASWKWEITPVNAIDNGVSTPAYTIIAGSFSSTSVQVRFNYSGKYKVCMTASNKKGTGNKECKTDYITVTPAINMPTSGTVTITNSSGYLYDNGGPNKNPSGYYVQNKAVIAGCADSVFLVFTQFDLACGMDYIALYEGKDATGKSLNKCSNQSYSGSNFGATGYTGGPSSSSTGCAYTTAPGCIPAITDTFKASKSMYIEMGIYGYTSTPGFEAYYW
ncbi:MAG: hypothetical protein EOP47_23035, partial [Sphingobacteriaceae bacterium]